MAQLRQSQCINIPTGISFKSHKIASSKYREKKEYKMKRKINIKRKVNELNLVDNIADGIFLSFLLSSNSAIDIVYWLFYSF